MEPTPLFQIQEVDRTNAKKLIAQMQNKTDVVQNMKLVQKKETEAQRGIAAHSKL